ncbi:MAG: hypothetical protein AAFQ11_08170, partial [Pseudomonadota bacterium]
VDAMQQQSKEASDAVIEVTQKEYHHLLSELGGLRDEIRSLRKGETAADIGAGGGTSPPAPPSKTPQDS